MTAYSSSQKKDVVKLKMLQKVKKTIVYTPKYMVLIIIAVICIVPLLWAFAASFSPLDKTFEYAYPFSWKAFFPVDFTIEAYQNIFERGFGDAILKTLGLGIVTVILGGFICTSAGFAFARFKFPGKTFLFLIVLITFTIPGDLTVIPRYILIKNWGWINSWQALLVPLLGNSLIIFMSSQFFTSFSQEIIDAARVDGASWLKIYFSIVLPISKPLLISLGLILFLSQWDSYFWPLLVAPNQNFRVVQLALTDSVQEYQTIWNELLAGSMLAAVIPILLLLPFQNYFINAVVGGVKE
jgi:multiple sugar transport system permease protein/putative chitobiose transport system permease protein